VSPTLLDLTQTAGRALGVHVQSLEVRRPEDLGAVFQVASATGLEAFVLLVGAVGATEGRPEIVDLAVRHSLPVMFPIREVVEDGGLMAYTEDTVNLYRRAASYVDRVLRGANPADLPVEQPMAFDFVVNRRAAAAIGFTLATPARLQVTEWLE
jgi:putative ABC transport system substrate-binding protein